MENSKLKDFEEIKDIYMASQLEVLNSMPSFDSFLYQEAGPMEFNIKITDISLSYTMSVEMYYSNKAEITELTSTNNLLNASKAEFDKIFTGTTVPSMSSIF